MVVLLNIQDLAERAKVSRDTIYKHWRDLGGFKIGGSIRFDWDRTRERLFEKALKEEKEVVFSVHGGRSVPSGRRIPHPAGRKGRRNRRETIFERIPDRYGLLGDMK